MIDVQEERTSPLLPPLPAELRDDLLALVLSDLLGPAGGAEEELSESVRERYLIGMLAPRKQQEHIDPATQDDILAPGDDNAEDGPMEQSVSQAPTLFPSSFGMTCCVAFDATQLEITASWGRYYRAPSAVQKDPKTGDQLLIWKRQPMGGTTTITLHEGNIAPWKPEPERQPAVFVRGTARRGSESWIVSLFLVNAQEEKKPKDATWIFQPEISIRDPNGSAIFHRRAWSEIPPHMGAEERAMVMRYRNQIEFAVGHGVSVRAEPLPDLPTQATRIATSVAPIFELPPTTFTNPSEQPSLANLTLDMKALAETSAEALPAILNPMVETYAAWIASQRERITNDPDLAPYQEVAASTLDLCNNARKRIQAGIDLLVSNEQAAEAFAFMNRAMWLQRIQTILADEFRNGKNPQRDAIDIPANRSWRLFQLAFILLNLPSLTDVHHAERSNDPTAMADLLWFPTGGGKTEAYLGLTAYTLAIRRLQGVVAGRSGMDGVAVLMRYTLRLLTLQQFQRATALICACEVIRRDKLDTGDARWGTTPFRVGLWVGQRTTPNTIEQSREAMSREYGHAPRSSTVGGSGTPHQLTTCPWCGTAIDPKHIIVDRDRKRTIIYCGDPHGDCPFSERKAPQEGLPVLVVDEEIYHRLPSLLIATVDKFAQLPWKGATQMLFGQVQQVCERHGFIGPDMEGCNSGGHRADAKKRLSAAKVLPCAPLRPPDLIIQDELHLISGPLGTLVGLYETAVDRLASWEVEGIRVRPKVIASTATVRQASEQIHALFLRQVAVFPPPGLDASDNFFAVQREATRHQPGRMYLGICAPGKRHKAVLIRIYVAFLAASWTLYLRNGHHADPWLTLVGYFNTMRELGGMRRMVDDDVQSRLKFIDQHGLAKRTHVLRLEELTSRKGATDIPKILALLETQFTSPSSQQATTTSPQEKPEPGQKNPQPKPLDVLLATNMISVGVDVRRLGLMVVSGQPKTTAEYIQATSRVGRNTPGLVCTIFNWSRPRDLSHYEQFAHYHATFYQHVEALSVTPFSARALDRGLSALLVSYVRLLGDEYNANKQAGNMKDTHDYVRAVLDEVPERAARVTGESGIADAVREKLRERIAFWQQEAQPSIGGRTLAYQREGDTTVALLKKPEEKDWDTFTCLNSLRDVEPMVKLWMGTGPLGNERGQEYHAVSAPSPPPPPTRNEIDEEEDA